MFAGPFEVLRGSRYLSHGLFVTQHYYMYVPCQMLPDSLDSSQLFAPEVYKHALCKLLSAVLSSFPKKISIILKKFSVHPRDNIIKLMLNKFFSDEVSPREDAPHVRFAGGVT